MRNGSFDILFDPERSDWDDILICSELKRRLKAEQKAKEKAEKEEARTLAVAAQSKSEKKEINEEEISPNVSSGVL